MSGLYSATLSPRTAPPPPTGPLSTDGAVELDRWVGDRAAAGSAFGGPCLLQHTGDGFVIVRVDDLALGRFQVFRAGRHTGWFQYDAGADGRFTRSGPFPWRAREPRPPHGPGESGPRTTYGLSGFTLATEARDGVRIEPLHELHHAHDRHGRVLWGTLGGRCFIGYTRPFVFRGGEPDGTAVEPYGFLVAEDPAWSAFTVYRGVQVAHRTTTRHGRTVRHAKHSGADATLRFDARGTQTPVVRWQTPAYEHVLAP